MGSHFVTFLVTKVRNLQGWLDATILLPLLGLESSVSFSRFYSQPRVFLGQPCHPLPHIVSHMITFSTTGRASWR